MNYDKAFIVLIFLYGLPFIINMIMCISIFFHKKTANEFGVYTYGEYFKLVTVAFIPLVNWISFYFFIEYLIEPLVQKLHNPLHKLEDE